MLRAELRKAATTPTLRLLWAAAITVVVIGDYTTVSSADADGLTGHLRDQPFHMLSAINLSLFAVLVGVRSITDEYRYDTISWTLLTRPRRRRALAAKGVVAAGSSALIGLTAQLAGVPIALWTIDGRGAKLTIDLADAAAVAGVTVGTAGWALLGVAIGTVVRSQVIAVAGALVWVLAIENLGPAVVGGAARVLPGQAAYALGGALGSDGLPPHVAAGVLGLYLAAFFGVASLAFTRRPLLDAV